MAPFTHVSPNWDSRFHDGGFAAYYAANNAETALAETMHHRSEVYRASDEALGWFSQYREPIGQIDITFHDLFQGHLTSLKISTNNVILNP